MRHLHYALKPQGSGSIMEAGGKAVRATGWTRRELLSAIFWAQQSSCLMNSQPLWSPAQDLHKIRPVNSPHGSGGELMRGSQFLEYVWSICSLPWSSRWLPPSMCVQVALIGLSGFYIYEERSGYQVKRGMCWGGGEEKWEIPYIYEILKEQIKHSMQKENPESINIV